MSLKLVTRGSLAIDGATGPETGEALALSSADAATQVVDLAALGPRGGYPLVTVRFRHAGGNGEVQVPITSLPADRRRGWSELRPDDASAGAVLVYQIYDEAGDTVLFLDAPSPEDWMARVRDDVSLTDLLIPGAHESSAIHGYYISQCQTVALDQQLKDGIRFCDVRLKVNEGDLQTYHGIRPQYSTLRQHLDWAEDFLRAHPSETLILSLKEEGEHHPEFGARVYAALKEHDGGALWRIANDVPTLGQARGKGIVFTRFSKDPGAPAEQWSEGLGLHPPQWPDDRRDGFEVPSAFGGTTFRCHDWYGVQNPAEIAEKAARVAGFLEPTLQSTRPQPLALAFNSGATFPFATPQWVSRGLGATSIGLGIEGTNARLTDWLLRRALEGRRPRASVLLDYYQTNSGLSGLARLLVALNFV